ncbi:MAG: HypC/HybG/HupF family hydrogenase formation chaperone [Clostridia bacterium]|nr:HypC/HybG/HupF family hydrogenase formation chaperone [Clostridia bacterium]
MCIAVVGRVIEINGTVARVDCMGNKMNIELGLVDAKVDDRVLIHAGCAIQVIDEVEAENITRLYGELYDEFND